jgi:hypothetical protein
MFWHQRFLSKFSFAEVAPQLAQSVIEPTDSESNLAATVDERPDGSSNPDGKLILPLG